MATMMMDMMAPDAKVDGDSMLPRADGIDGFVDDVELLSAPEIEYGMTLGGSGE